MSASEIERTLVRLAHEIVEKSNGSGDLCLVGIKRRGVPLAERLGKLISGIEKRPVDTGTLDIQFYRDDLSTADVRPVVTPGSVGEIEVKAVQRVILPITTTGTKPVFLELTPGTFSMKTPQIVVSWGPISTPAQ